MPVPIVLIKHEAKQHQYTYGASTQDSSSHHSLLSKNIVATVVVMIPQIPTNAQAVASFTSTFAVVGTIANTMPDPQHQTETPATAFRNRSYHAGIGVFRAFLFLPIFFAPPMRLKPHRLILISRSPIGLESMTPKATQRGLIIEVGCKPLPNRYLFGVAFAAIIISSPVLIGRYTIN